MTQKYRRTDFGFIVKSAGLFISFILLVSACNEKNLQEKENDFYLHNGLNRTAAEWEPALGTLIVWPLSIPYKLVVELAHDNHLYTMLENENEMRNAVSWYMKWGIDTSHVTFIYADQGVDASWTRDWGPSAVFLPDGQMKISDGKYLYATPVTDLACNDSLAFQYYNSQNGYKLTQIDDDATLPLADQLGIGLLDLPFVNTGGNWQTDGIGTAFSSCVIVSENKISGLSEDSLMLFNKQYLGINNYNILSNFEFYGIQHIDCLMKLLDEETILVAEPPKDHELYPVYENIVENELSKIKTSYGRTYKILRIKTDRYEGEFLAAYTNSLILNKTIYVPLFNIEQDAKALSRWAEVMPGYEVKGFTFSLDEEQALDERMKNIYDDYGWNHGDALHCRTRAIWDPEMLFISVKKADRHVKANHSTTIHASIIDYSRKGLIDGETNLYWKSKKESSWNKITLTHDGDGHFYAEIPAQITETQIEYYIAAASNSGKTATRPLTAPENNYTFETSIVNKN